MKRLIALFPLLFLACGCHRVMSDRLAALGMKPASDTADTLVLAGARGRIVLHRDSACAVVNGVPVQLPAPATRDRRAGWDLPDAAVDGILRPVLNAAPREVRVILIDPGHGGRDIGTLAVSGHKEKDLNLELGLRLADALRAAGFTVHLTRDADRFLPLEKRAELAAARGAQLFISIHHNSAPNRKAEGIETFALNAQTPDERWYAKPALRLAYLVQRSQSGSKIAPDRGVRTARFKVLRLAAAPAILIEAGFLSHADEAARCAEPARMERLAAAVVRAVTAYRDGGEL